MSEPAEATKLLDYSSPHQTKPTRFRWFICALLLYATAVNYVDRSILNAMAPDLGRIFHWQPYQFGLINAAFTMAYGIGFLIMGRLVDAVGTRKGYAISLVCWTLAAIATAFTNTPFQFGLARFALGLGEAGNFPAAIKTVAEWFPKRQRATATGLVNAGSNLGALLAPIVAFYVVPMLGWRAAFCVTPILAILWLFLWLKFYRSPSGHPHVNQAELDLIHEDAAATTDKPRPVKWRSLLPHRQTWSFIVAKLVTDPIWGFFLFWSGIFFHDQFGVELKGVALPLIYIYALADIGSISGGMLSSTLLKRGWSTNAARKTALLTCALLVLPVIGAPMVPRDLPGGIWIAATLIGLALAAHQGFSSNLFTTTSDMFPKRAVSSVVGLGGVAGALGGMALHATTGVIRETTGSLMPIFVVASLGYVITFAVMQMLIPKLKPVPEAELESTTMPRAVSMLLAAVLGFVVGIPLSYLFQNTSLSLHVATAAHPTTLPAIFNFPQYMASVIDGDIFLCLDHHALVSTLLRVPLLSAATLCLAAAVLHNLLFPRKSA